jgi:PHP family Zn ribbon phosphoesterase
MPTTSAGLGWLRIDLNFHSPGSSDFKDKTASPEEIVAKVKEAGLDAFAVTDHNTGDWIDRLKVAANREGIVVFPGVEVTVPGGERNVHLLAIFDPSQGTERVNDFLAQVLITVEKRGSTESLAQFTVNDVIDKICENDGIALLAHCDSTSGVTSEMLGQQRIDIIQNPKLLGAEITNDDTASFFTGSDQVYKRKLAP